MPLKLDPAITNVPPSLSEFFEKSNNKPATKKGITGIGNSSAATGIEVRMLPPLIKDNRTERIFPFPGFAKLYCVTIIVSDLPNQTVGGIDLDKFPRIGDNEHLPINKTLFYWQAANANEAGPNQIHFISRVIKSKAALRDTAKILTEMKGNEDYKSLVSNLGSLLKKASGLNPIAEGLFALSSIVGKYLGQVEDKDLGTVIQSFTTLHGDFDKTGINRHVFPTRNVDFEFELVVRDAEASKKSLNGKPGTKGFAKGASDDGEEVVVDLVPL